MAKNTINYNFILPDKAEAYDINVVNSNTIKIDAQIKSNEDKIKDVENSLDQLELKDTEVDVVAENKKMNIVIEELRDKDRLHDLEIIDLKSELNGYVSRHKIANDNIQKSIND